MNTLGDNVNIPYLYQMNWYYISGFFDADGSLSAIRPGKGKSKTIQVSFHNTELVIIEAIQQYIKQELGFNGTICAKKKALTHHKVSYELRYCYNQGLQVVNKLVLLHPMKVHRVKIYNKIQEKTKRNGKYTDAELKEREALLEEFFNNS